MNNQSKLLVIVVTVFLGYVAADWMTYYNAAALRLEYPYDTFLFSPRAIFSDFTLVRRLAEDLNPYFAHEYFKSNYLPLANVVFYVFAQFPKIEGFVAYTICFLVPFGGMLLLFLRSYGPFGVVSAMVLTFLSYPVLFNIDRANIEGIMAVWLLLFVWALQKDRPVLGPLALAVAASMKAYPILFVFLYVAEKRWREATLSVALTGALSIVSLFMHQGSFFQNLAFILGGFNIDSSPSFEANSYIQWGIGLYTMLKTALIRWGLVEKVNLPLINKAYIVFAATMLAATAWYSILPYVERWKRCLALTLAMLLLPQLSVDYKLLELYPAMLLFLEAEEEPWLDTFFALFLGLALIPMPYGLFPDVITDASAHDMGMRAYLRPVIMLAMLGVLFLQGASGRIRVRSIAKPDAVSGGQPGWAGQRVSQPEA